MKKSELQEIIREVVREEFKLTIKEYLKTYVPAVVGSVVHDLVEQQLLEFNSTSNNKRGTLREALELETDEWPTLNGIQTTSKAPVFNRGKMASMLGYGDDAQRGQNTLTMTLTSEGNPVPVDPNSIPEEIVNVINKDYRGMLKKLDQATRSLRG